MQTRIVIEPQTMPGGADRPEPWLPGAFAGVDSYDPREDWWMKKLLHSSNFNLALSGTISVTGQLGLKTNIRRLQSLQSPTGQQKLK